MKKEAVQENLALVQNTLERWLSFRKFLLVANTDQEISSEDEANFLEIKSSVARNVRALGERSKDAAGGGNLDYGEKTIRELLNKCVSVMHLRALPINDKRQIYKDWHGAFVRLSRSVGALKFMSEGYVPPVAAKKGSKGTKGGAKKAVIVVAVVAALLIGGGIAAVMFGLV